MNLRLQILLGTLGALSSLVVFWCWYKQWRYDRDPSTLWDRATGRGREWPWGGWLVIAIICYSLWWLVRGA